MNPTIEKLRKATAADPGSVRLTPKQVRSVVDGLIACHSRAEIAKAAGLDDFVVLDLVADFGTWLTHVHKRKTATTLVSAADMTQNPLFQVEGSEADARQVIVPDGFAPRDTRKEPGGPTRDVRKALAAIVTNPTPDDELIQRYLDRKYSTGARVLTFPLVAVLWRFATLGRLDQIDEVNPASPTFNALVVAAYDLIEVARRDAMAAFELLCTVEVATQKQVKAVLDACAKARWAAESDMNRLERIAQMAAVRDSSIPLLAKELRFFARRVESNPAAYRFESIADLNDGQVRRIGIAGGLTVEGGNKGDELEIRRRLQAMGLGADVDRFLSDGLKAAQAGIIETYWEAIERRVDGDPAWDIDLQEAFAAVSV